METMIYLQHHHQFVATTEDEPLRQQLKTMGIDARRISRFSQLALLGILPLQSYIPPQSTLYLASSFNSPSKFDKMFSALMTQNLPSPLDFMANIGNAATFQVAQALKLTGASVFLVVDETQFWQPLWLAFNDLMTGESNTAVVGWAYEKHHQQDHKKEGSQWLVLSNTAESALDFFTLSEIANNTNLKAKVELLATRDFS